EVILVDVRTQEEYDEKHIDGAILIPNETITDTEPEQLSDKDAEILVYCKSGNRSNQAAEKLADMGFSNVYNILGGISEWPY
ncbi:MAG: rhodanese-like domain-containing protein, partial [Syntrophaceticus sp.]|nr:rhodanese-like domain-containing protein [Syntrophaceticus sp.]